MTKTVDGYLIRLRRRQYVDRLKRLIVFGMIIGSALFLIGGAKYFFIVGSNSALFLAAFQIGILFLSITAIAPIFLSPLETAWMFCAKFVGKTVFSILLLFIYFLFFVPVGALLRKTKGGHPFYSWNSAPPSNFEGWTPKTISLSSSDIGDVKRHSMIFDPFYIFSYFIRSGNFLVIPVLLILVFLGITMFFVQTSTLAPFIYTLF